MTSPGPPELRWNSIFSNPAPLLARAQPDVVYIFQQSPHSDYDCGQPLLQLKRCILISMQHIRKPANQPTTLTSPSTATFYPPTSSENKLRTIGGIFLLQRVMLEISVWFEDVTRMLMFVFLIRQFPDDTTLCLKWEIGCLIRFIY